MADHRAPGALLLPLAIAAPHPDLSGLDDRAWQRLDTLAAGHKLQPWLAERWGDAAELIPPAIMAAWREVRRHAALTALRQRADLFAAVRRSVPRWDALFLRDPACAMARVR